MAAALGCVLALFRRAKAPATCGAAIDVPVFAQYAAPPAGWIQGEPGGTPAVTSVPGAIRSTSGEWLEDLQTRSFFVVLPTAMALVMQAGIPTELFELLLPEATMAAMSAARRLLKAAVSSLFVASHWEANSVRRVVTLRLTAAILKVFRRAMTRFSASSTSPSRIARQGVGVQPGPRNRLATLMAMIL